MDEHWLTVKHAAEMWNEVTGLPDKQVVGPRPASAQSMRRLAREGQLERMGIGVELIAGAYFISRVDLTWYLWLTGQEISRRAEAAVGVTQERTYEVIGEVGELHHGNGEAMDAYWRESMRREFVLSVLSDEAREAEREREREREREGE